MAVDTSIRGTDKSAITGDAYIYKFDRTPQLPYASIYAAQQKADALKKAKDAKDIEEALKTNFKTPHRFFYKTGQQKVSEFADNAQRELAASNGVPTHQWLQKVKAEKDRTNTMLDQTASADKIYNEVRDGIYKLPSDEYNVGGAIQKLAANTADLTNNNLPLNNIDQVQERLNINPFEYFKYDNHVAKRSKELYPEANISEVYDPNGRKTYSTKFTGRLGLYKTNEKRQPIVDSNGKFQITDDQNVLDSFDAQPDAIRTNDMKVLDAYNSMSGNKYQSIDEIPKDVLTAQKLKSMRNQVIKDKIAQVNNISVMNKEDAIAPRVPSSAGEGTKYISGEIYKNNKVGSGNNELADTDARTLADAVKDNPNYIKLNTGNAESYTSDIGFPISQKNGKAVVKPFSAIQTYSLNTGEPIGTTGNVAVEGKNIELRAYYKNGKLIKSDAEEKKAIKNGTFGEYVPSVVGDVIDNAGVQEWLKNEGSKAENLQVGTAIKSHFMNGGTIGTLPEDLQIEIFDKVKKPTATPAKKGTSTYSSIMTNVDSKFKENYNTTDERARIKNNEVRLRMVAPKQSSNKQKVDGF